MISFSHTNHLHTSQAITSQAAVTPEISAEEQNKKTAESQNPVNATVESESSNKQNSSNQLTEAEQKQVEQLKLRDREVRAHEQAHAAAAGSLANGGPSYEFQTGPDGKRYAVGGSVSIDTSPVDGDPKATLDKAQKIQRAALAPAEPSQQDRAVAAQAAAMAAEARAELASQNQDASIRESSNAESTQNYCADCGGQHASDSHGISVQLEGVFKLNNESITKTIFDFTA